jgi:hypothetical protein
MSEETVLLNPHPKVIFRLISGRGKKAGTAAALD